MAFQLKQQSTPLSSFVCIWSQALFRVSIEVIKLPIAELIGHTFTTIINPGKRKQPC
ncbi:hypothetical protein M378DRAFT_166198 [Amanita muscaria Koide BX008]|uniref:Uncharacterized protein n=1 Tax=Amanita muscaria (strain Koide BX008) TaxID=946122 RepID=A0A0C2T674_AMAMK|nr:hypothetical protein M378DRAFT_166198 [Amanita muscaria Koide BX008]